MPAGVRLLPMDITKPKKHVSTTKSGRNGYAYRYDSDFDNNLIELTANFQKAFGKHNVSVLIGYNYEDNTNSNLSMSNYDFPTDAYSYNKMEAGMALKRGEASMTSYKNSDKLIGLFTRVSYNFNDRYLLMAFCVMKALPSSVKIISGVIPRHLFRMEN